MTKILVMRFQIIYTENAFVHIRLVEKKYCTLIHDEIEKRLIIEPMIKARNRKHMGETWVFGTWELRCGPGNRFRIFYDVDESRQLVIITAIGIKKENRLIIGGKEIPL